MGRKLASRARRCPLRRDVSRDLLGVTPLGPNPLDKQARDAMVSYMKEQFEGMIDNAMERAEEVGQLRAENVQLKSLLDAGPSTGGDNADAPEGVEYRQ